MPVTFVLLRVGDMPAAVAPETEPAHRVSTTIVLAVAAVGGALIAMFGEDDSFTGLTMLAALAGLVPWALLAGGVRVPVPLFASLGLAAAAPIVLVDVTAGGLFPLMVVVVEVARSAKRWYVLAGTLAAVAGLIAGYALRQGSAHESGLVYFSGGVAISTLSGLMLRRQEALTEQVQAMQARAIEHAAEAERTHIAREVHDVVAHSLTVVMLHLTGARRVLRSDPERAEAALAQAEAVGRASLDNVRQMVGLLRADTSGTGAAAPQPGVDDIAELIERARASGMNVAADVDAGTSLDPARQLVAYRVVQESLSNVAQHSPGAACSVRLRDGRLRVENTTTGDAARPPGRMGVGLIGMAERVRAAGGTFHAGPTATGGWLVDVSLPREGVPA